MKVFSSLGSAGLPVNRFSPQNIETSLDNSRLEVIWKPLFEHFLQNPIIGYGKGRIGDLIYIVDEAHNYLLRISVEGGLVALSVFLLFILNFFKTAYALFRKTVLKEHQLIALYSLSVATITLIVSQVQDALYSSKIAIPFYLCVGLINYVYNSTINLRVHGGKRIFILRQYASTPDQPGGTRHYAIATELARNGFEVYIFASNYSHMTKRDIKIFSGRYLVEDTGNVKFVWLKTFPYSENDWRRLLNILDYGIKSYRIAIELAGKGLRPDVIVGSVAHVFSVAAAYFAGKTIKARFFMDIGDLWPEAIVTSKKIKEKTRLIPCSKKRCFSFTTGPNHLSDGWHAKVFYGERLWR